MPEAQAQAHMFDVLVTLIVRVAIGIVAGGVTALAGYFIGWFFLLQPWMSMTQSFVVLTVATGIFGGLGAMAGWLRLDEEMSANLPSLALTVLGGVGGAWAGLFYAQEVFDTSWRSIDAHITAIASAGIAANFPTLILFGVREFKNRRV